MKMSRLCLILSSFAAITIASAAQRHIDFGTSAANDGDKASVAFHKIEDNFVENYASISVLESGILGLTTTVSGLGTDVADLSSTVSGLVTDVAGLSSTVSVLGTDVLNLMTAVGGKQPLSSELTAIAALTPSDDDILQRKSGLWVNRTLSQLAVDMSLAPVGATYITQTPSGSLSAEQALSSLTTGLLKSTTGTGVLSIASAGTDYEVPLTFSTGLSRSTNTVTVDASQNISTLSNLTSNGFVKTGGGAGILSVDTNTYLTTSSAASSYQPLDDALTALAGGSDFVAFSGPASSTKTFSLPNASASILTDNTAVTAAQGGTGIASYAIGDILYASGSTTLSKLADIATGNVVLSGGVGAAPSWGKVSLTAAVTGTLPVGNGGAGITSYTVGDILYASGSTTLSKLADVATGNALISGGTGTAPSWGKIDLTTTTTGTLPVGNGGTGIASYTVGDIAYASGSTTLISLADVATGNVLISGGVGVAPSYGKVNLTTAVTGMLGSSNGGTGNGNFAVTGPASTTKTFTFPNATSTVLTTNALVTVAQGGTGAATITGLVKGNGTSAFTAAAASDISFSGTTTGIGGGALLAGACTSGTVTVTGATTSMVAMASPNTYPGDGATWSAQVTSSNTVTVRVCASVALTPTSSTYNVRVLQ